MIILPHLLIGAAIGLRIHNAWAVFILALASHFIADKIPHWDYMEEEVVYMNKKSFLIFLFKVAIDVGLGGILLFLLLWRQNAWPYALFGAFISALPDFPAFLRKFFPQTKWLASYQKLHNLSHMEQKPGKKILFPLISELIITAIVIIFLKI